jgi:hypothetical protein
MTRSVVRIGLTAVLALGTAGAASAQTTANDVSKGRSNLVFQGCYDVRFELTLADPARQCFVGSAVRPPTSRPARPGQLPRASMSASSSRRAAAIPRAARC